ncbi:hypothetical protein ACFLQL_00945 [Verrucomicrobiota bacterium]
MTKPTHRRKITIKKNEEMRRLGEEEYYCWGKMKMTHNIRWRLLIIAAVAGIAVVLVGILLFPKLDRVRESARQINDLSNLNSIYKAISGWGLDPVDSFRQSVPPSLVQLVKENKITKEMLVSYTGKPIEYYPAGDNEDIPVMLGVRHVD